MDDVQVIAVADPAESFSLESFYYKGQGGRLPTQALIEKHYAAKTPHYRCAAYEDFREMLQKEKAIDAVLCATPDHLHATISVAAMKAGKHVYCEKPLTHNVWEAREVARIAKETGVATQMGNIGHSEEGMRQTCEWIQAGAIGPVREVHAWVSATRWNKDLTGLPPGSPPFPKAFIGNCGSDHATRARFTPPTSLCSGATFGPSAAEPSGTSSAMTSTDPAGRSTCKIPPSLTHGPRATWTKKSHPTVNSATTTLALAASEAPSK